MGAQFHYIIETEIFRIMDFRSSKKDVINVIYTIALSFFNKVRDELNALSPSYLHFMLFFISIRLTIWKLIFPLKTKGIIDWPRPQNKTNILATQTAIELLRWLWDTRECMNIHVYFHAREISQRACKWKKFVEFVGEREASQFRTNCSITEKIWWNCVD